MSENLDKDDFLSESGWTNSFRTDVGKLSLAFLFFDNRSITLSC